jgi:hypothetical protein
MSDSENCETIFNHFLLHFLRYLCNFCPNTCSQTGHTNESVAFRRGYLKLHQRCDVSLLLHVFSERIHQPVGLQFGRENGRVYACALGFRVVSLMRTSIESAFRAP